MHCYAFRNVVSQRRSLKEFRMHCYAFVMLYLKDSPLGEEEEEEEEGGIFKVVFFFLCK